MKDKTTAELIAAAREEADDPTTHPYHEELFQALADRLGETQTRLNHAAWERDRNARERDKAERDCMELRKALSDEVGTPLVKDLRARLAEAERVIDDLCSGADILADGPDDSAEAKGEELVAQAVSAADAYRDKYPKEE